MLVSHRRSLERGRRHGEPAGQLAARELEVVRIEGALRRAEELTGDVRRGHRIGGLTERSGRITGLIERLRTISRCDLKLILCQKVIALSIAPVRSVERASDSCAS